MTTACYCAKILLINSSTDQETYKMDARICCRCSGSSPKLIKCPSFHPSLDQWNILRLWNYKVHGGFFSLLSYISETFTTLFVTESLLVTTSKLLSSHVQNATISCFPSTILAGFVPWKRPVMRTPATDQYIWVVWVHRVLCCSSKGDASLCCLTTEQHR